MLFTNEIDRGDVWVRCHGPFQNGFIYNGHRHWIDHDSYIHEGTTLRIRYRHQKDGGVVMEEVYTGPCRVLIAAGIYHEIEVLSEQGSWDCEFKKPKEPSPLTGIYNQELWD
jgi:hypothetical protein